MMEFIAAAVCARQHYQHQQQQEEAWHELTYCAAATCVSSSTDAPLLAPKWDFRVKMAEQPLWK